MSELDFSATGPAYVWPRPALRVATTYREATYAPEVIEVEIDRDGFTSADIAALISAMAYVAYGPIPPPAEAPSGNGQLAMFE